MGAPTKGAVTDMVISMSMFCLPWTMFTIRSKNFVTEGRLPKK